MQLVKSNCLFILPVFGCAFLITIPILSAKETPKIGCGLELTEEQLDEVYTIKEEIRETVKSLQKQRRVVSKNLRNELKSEEPSEIEVGKLVILKNNLSEEISEARDSFKESFMTILTLEQLDRMGELCFSQESDQSEYDTSEKQKHKGKLKSLHKHCRHYYLGWDPLWGFGFRGSFMRSREHLMRHGPSMRGRRGPR